MSRPVVLLVCSVALLAGCGGDGSDSADATTTSAPTTTTAAPKGTWGSPMDAANNLLSAWKNSDGEAGLRSATQEALLALFGRTYYPHSSRGCDQPSQLGSDCVFRLSGAGQVRLHVKSDPAAGWLVDKVTFLD